MKKTITLGILALCAFSIDAGALEIQAAQPTCSSADVKAGKALWSAIDKAADGSAVTLTNTENRQLWCYSDSRDPTARPDAALKVTLKVTPDPDADLDGVPDASDKCANTPPDCTYQEVGKTKACVSRVPVDAKGCPK